MTQPYTELRTGPLSRRTLLAGTAAAGLIATAQPWSATSALALPNVDLEWLLVEAQVEPKNGPRSNPKGSRSTKLVQEALTAKGIATTADGIFGKQTIESYTKWQRRLGYGGLHTNGQPQPKSLTRLGEGRFTVINKVVVGDQVPWHEQKVNERTRAMLREVRRRIGKDIQLYQGSYSQAGPSAGTHAGGGAVDIDTRGHKVWTMVRVLRDVGFAAWYRPYDPKLWPAHIHAIAILDWTVSDAARDQVADYHAGRNGLSNGGPDNTPKGSRGKFTWWEAYQRRT